MMNFILDINVVFFGLSLFILSGICGYSVDKEFVKNPKIAQGLSWLGLFLFFIFCLYFYFAITLSNDSHKEVLKEEISKEYNVQISGITPDTLGFLLCERSDYQSQICKEYISYFIFKAVRYEQELQEKIAKEREMQEIEKDKEKEAQRLEEEKKINIRNRIEDIIKTTGEKR